jgi:glycosyltransferase involved in cell wall biosynthesis
MTKLLVISNFYPPHTIGGYELLCEEVMSVLAQRGYTIKILTSNYRANPQAAEENISRELTLESDLDYYSLKTFWSYPWKRRRNLRIFREEVARFSPDIVFFWGMWGLSKNIAFEAERIMGARVVYYLANPWPIQPSLHKQYWDAEAYRPWMRWIKNILRLPIRIYLNAEWVRPKLEYRFSPVCSAATKKQLLDAGIPLKNAPVIYEGIRLPRYLDQAEKRQPNDLTFPISMLFVGILAPHKGVHTAIEALAFMNEKNREKFRFTILGSGQPHYEKYLQDLVGKNKLENLVTFQKPIPRTELPGILGKHQVLVLPSVWEEPLALIMQEGLAAGMVVVGSTKGGTKEILVENVNGLLFPAEDYQSLASQLERLISDPGLMERLSRQGRKTAEEKFNLDRMVTELESYLREVVDTTHAPAVYN